FLFGVGFYQHWRAAGDAASLFSFPMTVLASTVLFIGQSLLLAHAGRARTSYRDLYQASWGLFIQVLFCGLCALGLWTAWRAFPAAGFALLAGAPFVMAAMTQILDHAALRRIEWGLTYVLGASLPALLLFSVLEILSWSLTHRLPPLVFSALVAVSM